MTTEQKEKILGKNLENCNEATLYEMFDYLCSRIDFGKSFLDSTAVRCMNNLFIKLKEQKEKFNL